MPHATLENATQADYAILFPRQVISTNYNWISSPSFICDLCITMQGTRYDNAIISDLMSTVANFTTFGPPESEFGMVRTSRLRTTLAGTPNQPS